MITDVDKRRVIDFAIKDCSYDIEHAYYEELAGILSGNSTFAPVNM